MAQNVNIIPCDHFNYFNEKKGWKYVENALSSVVLNQIEGKTHIKLPLTGQTLQHGISKL